MPAPYYVQAVANEFLERGGREQNLLTPMKLLKLVYIAHGWHLAVSGLPLFPEPVQAWKYGPVVPSLFHEFKVFGGQPITQLAHASDQWTPGAEPSGLDFQVNRPFVPPGDFNTIRMLEWVWKTYRHKTGPELSELTHKDGTPWSKAVAKMKQDFPNQDWVPGVVIPDLDIREHYLELWKSMNGGKPK